MKLYGEMENHETDEKFIENRVVNLISNLSYINS
jgi:hypothetical protein